MAALEKRGDLQWRVKIRRRGYPVQSRTFDTKAEAERWARDVERDMDRGVFADRSEAEKNTLGDVLSRYLKEITPTKRGAAPEESRLKAMLRRPITAIKLAALSSKDFAKYRDQRLEQVGSNTVNKELNLLAHAIEVARREWGIHLPENPVRLIRRPPAGKARERRFVGDEDKRLLKACDDARNPFLSPIVRLALETAMRQGNLVSLQWRNVNLARRFIYLGENKTGEPHGIALSAEAIRVINSLPRSTSGKLFPGVTSEAVKQAFARACERAGIEDFHFHDLRHEATSRLFERGLNIMEVASITGHKTLQMLKRYTHLNASELALKLG